MFDANDADLVCDLVSENARLATKCDKLQAQIRDLEAGIETMEVQLNRALSENPTTPSEHYHSHHAPTSGTPAHTT